MKQFEMWFFVCVLIQVQSQIKMLKNHSYFIATAIGYMPLILEYILFEKLKYFRRIIYYLVTISLYKFIPG